MHDPAIEAEQIAALLDGRLPPAERDALLGRLADDPAWRDALVDAAAVLSPALPDVRVAAPSTPSPSDVVPTSNRWRRGTQFALAASILAALSLGVWRFSRTAPSDPLLIASETRGGLSVALFSRSEQWPRVRATSPEVGPVAIGARLGVLSVDLLFARSQGDSTTMTVIHEELVAALQTVPGSGAVLPLLSAPSEHDTTREGLSALRTLVDSNAYDAAAWIERARLTLQRPVQRDSAIAAALAHLARVPDAGAVRARLARSARPTTSSSAALSAELDAALRDLTTLR